MANRRFIQFFNTLHKMPVLLDCNFAVDPTDVSGKGITPSSLKGPGIQAVLMNSSASVTGDTTNTSAVVINVSSVANLKVGMAISGAGIPAGTRILSIDSATQITMTAAATATASTVTITYAAGSVNPSAGIILVQFQDCYNAYYSGNFQAGYALTGSALTSTVANTLYVITSLGTTTLAQWQAKGLPVGIVPAVGVAFIASATGALGGTGNFKAVGSSGVASIEYAGDPDKTLASSAALNMGVSSGAYMILKCFDYAGAVVAPLASSKLNLDFYLSNSSIKVQGE